MRQHALQPDSAWAEERALLRSNPSAVSGAKTDRAAGSRPVLHTHRDWHQSDQPPRHDAAIVSAGCPSSLANTNRSTFQFPLNKDTSQERRWVRGLSSCKLAM